MRRLHSLVIELTVGKGAVSVWENDELIGVSAPTDGSKRSEDVLVNIDSMLTDFNLTIDSVKEMVCSIGPGGYTGIRVGIATVRGLQRSAGLDAYGYSTIDALLLEADAAKSTVAVLDAGRNEYLIGEPDGFLIVKQVDFSAHLAEKGIESVIGAVTKPQELEERTATAGARYLDASDNVIGSLFRLHLERKGKGSALSPIYGRTFPAGRKA